LQWSDCVEIGVKALLLRRLRSLLSTLGIVFGVGAVIAMTSIGEGARREAIEQIELLGTNNIRIKQVRLTGEQQAEANRRSSAGLSYNDARLIRESVPDTFTLAPLKFVDAEVRFEGRQSVAQVVATSPEYEDVTSFRVASGRFVTAVDVRDYKRVCILGSEVKEELFGYRDPIGAQVRIGGTWFTTVGVMEAKQIREKRATVIKVRNINRDVFIPITTAIKRFPWTEDPSALEEIAVRVAHPDDLADTGQLIDGLLEQRHRGVKDYELIVPEELLAQAQRTQRLFNIVMGSIAGISLLVGGIGIMNIMLANVSERTREIGIRRALGATKWDIISEFLVETVLICLAGGIIGILFGFGMAVFITVFAGWETGFSITSVLVAFGTSASVGLLFGLFPARRAAELNPVEALRAQ
jgi:putative ABC transport system permease protein